MIVLDASALVDVIFDQAGSRWVLDEIAESEISAPAHQPAEVLSAVARLVRAAALDPLAPREALDEALDLPQRLVAPTPTHVRRAFAMRERIRVVHGLYVALADELGCPLVTTDRRLATADAPCEIRIPPPASGDPVTGPVPPPRG